MGSVIKDLLALVFQAQIPNLLILAGLICLGIAILGKFERLGFHHTRNERIFATAIGGMLLFIGLHLLNPAVLIGKADGSNESTPQPTITEEPPTYRSSPNVTETSSPREQSPKPSTTSMPARPPTSNPPSDTPSRPPAIDPSSTQQSPLESDVTLSPQPSIQSPSPRTIDFSVWEGTWSISWQDPLDIVHRRTLQIDIGAEKPNGVLASGRSQWERFEGEIIPEVDSSGEVQKLKFEGRFEGTPNPSYPYPCWEGEFSFDLIYRLHPPRFNGNSKWCPDQPKSDPKWDEEYPWNGTKIS